MIPTHNKAHDRRNHYQVVLEAGQVRSVNLLERLNRFPPKMCRLAARSPDGLRFLSYAEIAKLAGMSRQRASQISDMNNWDDLPMKTAVAFASACGIDLCRPRSCFYRRARRNKACWRNTNPQQRAMFNRLLDRHDQ
jgi:hypothetical protein